MEQISHRCEEASQCGMRGSDCLSAVFHVPLTAPQFVCNVAFDKSFRLSC